MCRMFCSYRRIAKHHDIDDLPPYRPINKSPSLLKCVFDISTPGTMIVSIENMEALKVTHVSTPPSTCIENSQPKQEKPEEIVLEDLVKT
jgi:hypothetical protein